MDVAFLFHLYQPNNQNEATLRKIAEESYIPLIRTIKNNKNLKVTLNIPLSLLELMDEYGYSNWINDVKELVQNEKVELTGSAAYHPILTQIPQDYVERQMTLDEYGLGYYFGRHTGFEGEKAVLIKDLQGFFPPELAVNKDLLGVIDTFGYKWVVVDETAIPDSPNYSQKYGVYEIDGFEIKIVCRNRSFSNMLSFKRDPNLDEIAGSVNFFRANNTSFVVVIDGEFFGHHYDQGIFILDSLLDIFRDMGVGILTLSDYVSRTNPRLLTELRESSWGASDEDMDLGVPLPMWRDPKNELHSLQWKIVEKLFEVYELGADERDLDDYETLPIWKNKELMKIDDKFLLDIIEKDLTVQKSISSDQFWWASKKSLPTGEMLYSSEVVKQWVDNFVNVANVLGYKDFSKFVQEQSEKIKSLL